MASTSLNLGEELLEATFIEGLYERPTSLTLELYKDDDPPAKDGTGGTEIGAGHVGKTITLNDTNWTVTDNTATNALTIQGDENGTSDVTATHFALWDGVELYWTGPLTESILVTQGNPFNIDAGGIDITFGGGFTTDWAEDILDHILTGAAIVWPTTNIRIDLVSTSTSAASPGTSVTGDAYAPVTVPCSTDFWVVADDEVRNGIDFEWLEAESEWTTTVGRDYYNDDTGQRLFFSNFGSARPVDVGHQARILEGTLLIRIL